MTDLCKWANTSTYNVSHFYFNIILECGELSNDYDITLGIVRLATLSMRNEFLFIGASRAYHRRQGHEAPSPLIHLFIPPRDEKMIRDEANSARRRRI